MGNDTITDLVEVRDDELNKEVDSKSVTLGNYPLSNNQIIQITLIISLLLAIYMVSL